MYSKVTAREGKNYIDFARVGDKVQIYGRGLVELTEAEFATIYNKLNSPETSYTEKFNRAYKESDNA